MFEKVTRGAGRKGGWAGGKDGKQNTQIVEVDIADIHIFTCNSLFQTVPCISVRSF